MINKSIDLTPKMKLLVKYLKVNDNCLCDISTPISQVLLCLDMDMLERGGRTPFTLKLQQPGHFLHHTDLR